MARARTGSPADALARRGVVLPAPATVDVGPEIVPARIAPGVVLHAGTRLRGAATSIGPGCAIGAEAPATVEDCCLGHGVALKGGFFAGSTFLDGVSVGSAAHVRPGTLLEEQAEAAHAVGLKQTILFPFVVTGSLVNFCDVLMAGGTSRRDHSEVGSSYVHFNFTPHGDKATASLVGDVPRGVRLDRPRIFLGGQGGLVGPVRIGYGTVIAAGTVWRKDAPEGGRLLAGDPAGGGVAPRPFEPGAYLSVERVVRNGLLYIGNLLALREWYRLVRLPAMAEDPFRRACVDHARRGFDLVLAERVKRLGEVADAMPRSLQLARARHGGALPEAPYGSQRRFAARWPALRAALIGGAACDAGAAARDRFLAAWRAAVRGHDYLEAVHALPPQARADATEWLGAIVEAAAAGWGPAPGEPAAAPAAAPGAPPPEPAPAPAARRPPSRAPARARPAAAGRKAAARKGARRG